jgi:protein-disulfide isomerase
MKSALGIVLLVSSALPLAGQMVLPAGSAATSVKDSSALKPPAGASVAIVEFEDLECPFCAYAAPMVQAAQKQYKIPVVHHDMLIQSHIWSRMAAIDARYLAENVSPAAAEDFRRDVFKNQSRLASRDDLQDFAGKWFLAHGHAMPFVMDASGRCAAAVQADCNLAVRMGLGHTPSIFVVTSKEWIEVAQPTELYAAIDRAEADLKSSGVGRRR